MSDDRPSQIQSHHLQRLAVGYVRQSTLRQAAQNIGSTAHQRSQTNLALKWGWSLDRVVVIDEDLGQSGTTQQGREGFQELFQLVVQGRVGAIFCSNTSRLSRATIDFENLIVQCRVHNTLLVVDGHIIDLNNSMNRLLARIQGCVSEFENELRKETFQSGKLAKIEKGFAISRPPAGYVEIEKGKWVIDPDRTVQQAIEEVFRIFREQGGVGGTLRRLVRQGRLLPVRRRGGRLEWVQPSRSRIHSILHNPAYAGHYAYARRQKTLKHPKPRWVDSDKWILKPNRHEGYITPAEWAGNIKRMHANRVTVQQPIGRGLALCQGLVRCGRCNRKMNTIYYPIEGGYRVTYTCNDAAAQYAAKNCWHVYGLALDALVAREVLSSFRLPDIETILKATGEVNYQHERAVRQREQELEDARYQVQRAKRQYDAVDPDNRRFAAVLEKECEQTLARLEQVERRHSAEPLAPTLAPTPEVVTAIRHLADDVPALWAAPSTQAEDRKKLVRLLIQEIYLVEMSDAYFDIRITFVGGVTTCHRLPRPGKAIVVAKALVAQGWDRAAIVDELGRQGFTTLRGRPFTRRAIGQLLCLSARKAARAGEDGAEVVRLPGDDHDQ